jgi:hypothetical protein
MQLRIAIKHSADCFVALPLQLVNQLYDRLEFISSTSSFIALEVIAEGRRIFVGWGGESSGHKYELEVPFHLAQCLGLQPGQEVNCEVNQSIYT